MENKLKCTALITAAGSGKRMGFSEKKQFLSLLGKPILAYTLEKFQNTDEIDEIVLVLPEYDIDFCKKEILDKYGFNKVKTIVSGGSERQESVYKGILAVKEADIILIHDGVRPFVKKEEILKVIEDAEKNGASVLAVRVKDSLRFYDGNVSKSVSRGNIWQVQTPQGFRKNIIYEAHEKAWDEEFFGTDDAALAEHAGYNVSVVEGSYDNIKITTPDDLIIAEAILKKEGDSV